MAVAKLFLLMILVALAFPASGRELVDNANTGTNLTVSCTDGNISYAELCATGNGQVGGFTEVGSLMFVCGNMSFDIGINP